MKGCCLNKEPLVSVLLPVYNNSKDVVNAIESVIKQTYSNWELILIDDCSTDNTLFVISDYLSDKKINVKLFKNNKNLGVYSSLNEGLIRSNGQYITRIDSDDTLAEDMLKTQVSFLENDYYIASQSLYQRGNLHKAFGEISIMYRKNIINKIGYYDSVRFAADTEFLHRMIRVYGNRINRVNKVLYYAQNRNNSLTTSESTGLIGTGGLIRNEYVVNFTEWHKKCGNNLYLDYPLKTRPFLVNDVMLP